MSSNRQVSPFAQLTGAEKQIRWMEYQSIRLPYVSLTTPEENVADNSVSSNAQTPPAPSAQNTTIRPQPPMEVPRTMPVETQSHHRQYDAVIARLKQAELQSRVNASRIVEKI